MTLTTNEIIKKLELIPLEPEGGYFREIYRSNLQSTISNDIDRALYTHIYYLLTPETLSAPHSVKHDEIWHFYGGMPTLHFSILDDNLDITVLGNDINAGMVPVHLVPSGTIQFALMYQPYMLEIVKNYSSNDLLIQSLSNYENINCGWSLMGATVVPGFEYDDYTHIELNNLSNLPDNILQLLVK